MKTDLCNHQLKFLETYNPEKGAVYYFTPHGNEVRKQPVYCIDQAKKNYDDIPSVDDLC